MPVFYSPGVVRNGTTVQLETATDSFLVQSTLLVGTGGNQASVTGITGFLACGGFIATNSSLGLRLSGFVEITGSGSIAVISGAVNDLRILGNGASGTIAFYTNSALRWTVNASGHIVPGSDNALDIGIVTTNEIRTIYVGTSIVMGSVTLTDGSSSFLQSNGGFIANNAGLGYRTVGGEFLLTSSGTQLNIDTGNSGSQTIRLRPGGTNVKFETNTTGISFYGGTPVARSAGWTITNDVTDRTFDANAGSVLELADVVATLIRDIAATQLIGAVA